MSTSKDYNNKMMEEEDPVREKNDVFKQYKGKGYKNKQMEEDPVREEDDVIDQDKGKGYKNKQMEEDPVREEDDVIDQNKILQDLLAAAMKVIRNGDDLEITISKRKNIADQNEAERAENMAKQNRPEGPTGGIPKQNWLVGLTRGMSSMAVMFGLSALGAFTGGSLSRIQAKEANQNMEYELMKQQQKAQHEAWGTAGFPSSITIKPDISVNPRFSVINFSKD